MIWVNLSLKVLFVLIVILVLYRQLFVNQDFQKSLDHFLKTLENGSIFYLVLCALLMPLNWLLESKKWQILVKPFENISLLKSLKAVVSGVSVALLTPNRIGEYGGRMLMVEAKNNWKAVISTVVSSFAQNIWNIGLGLLALIVFLNQKGELETYLYYTAIIISVVFLGVLILLYFNIKIAIGILQRWKEYNFIKKILHHLVLLEKYDDRSLASVLGIALLRYLVYFAQYFLILGFFGLNVNLWHGFIGIATIFLIQTSLPLPPILGFLARGEIALLVWEAYAFNDLSVLSSSYSLWLLNLIIPALLGSFVILTSNLWRTLGLNSLLFRRK